MEGLRGQMSIAEICNKHEISQGQYYKWRAMLLNGSDKIYIPDRDKEKEQMHKKIEKLNQHIGDEGAKALIEALKVNTSLSQIRFDPKKLSAEAEEALINLLNANTPLKTIYIAFNISDDRKSTPLKQVTEENSYKLAFLP